MTGSSISKETPVVHDGVPEQRRARELAAAKRARQGMADVRAATGGLLRLATALDDDGMRAPSLLPGWTRGHVVTHLARNADGLVNLLTWARTGVEHPMYQSDADRDADIEEGADRLAQVLHEDLGAACARFSVAGEQLSDSQWSAMVSARTPEPFPAEDIPSMRLFEVFVHTVDLDVGVGFEHIPDERLETALGTATARHTDRPDGPSIHLRVNLPNGVERVWDLVGGRAGPVHEVSGPPVPVLAWLTGRGDGAQLTGSVPTLPVWG